MINHRLAYVLGWALLIVGAPAFLWFEWSYGTDLRFAWAVWSSLSPAKRLALVAVLAALAGLWARRETMAALARRAWPVVGPVAMLALVLFAGWSDYESTRALYAAQYGVEEAARRMVELYIAASAAAGMLLQAVLVAAILHRGGTR